DRGLQDFPLLLREVMRLLDPQDVNAFQRLDFVDVSPQAIEQKLRTGATMNDRVVGDLELATQSKPLDLYLEQRIDRLGNLVLELTRAAHANLALLCKERSKPRSVP